MSTTKYGVFGILDSGALACSDNYVTMVVLHGFTWHAGVFIRLLPLAQKFNARIVLVNRRDYPGSAPYRDDELHELASITAHTPDALSILKNYTRERAKELYDFLELFVRNENIPVRGGLVVAGWSFGSVWITSLLANARDFPIGDLPLSSCIRRLVLYDTPYHSLGYAPPANFYNPLNELSKSPGGAFKTFQTYVSGYYSHGEPPDGLEMRKPLPLPRPTFETMSPEVIKSSLDPSPVNPGSSDVLLLEAGIQHGIFSALKQAMLYPRAGASSEDKPASPWDSVKLRHIWCDHSSWEVPWAAWALQAELEDAKTSGKQARAVEVVRVEGMNHFAHWEKPEQILHALLDDDVQERLVAGTGA